MNELGEDMPFLSGTVFVMVLLLTSPWPAAEQTGGAANRSPEVFSGTAATKNAHGAVSGTLVVTLRRVTPEFDRKVVETALKEGGYPRFLQAIRNAPQVGNVVLAGGKPHAIRYARERMDSGYRILVLVTDRPIYFVGGAQPGATPRQGFEVSVIELRIDPEGAGGGSLAAAARVRPDGDGGVLLDDYAEELITLSGITRKAS